MTARAAKRPARQAEQEQSVVVSTLASSLQRVADGDLTTVITADFPGRYQAIKDDFNQAIESLRQAMNAISTRPPAA